MTGAVVAAMILVVAVVVLVGMTVASKSPGAQRRRMIRDAEDRMIRDDTDAFFTGIELRRIADAYWRGNR